MQSPASASSDCHSNSYKHYSNGTGEKSFEVFSNLRRIPWHIDCLLLARVRRKYCIAKSDPNGFFSIHYMCYLHADLHGTALTRQLNVTSLDYRHQFNSK